MVRGKAGKMGSDKLEALLSTIMGPTLSRVDCGCHRHNSNSSSWQDDHMLLPAVLVIDACV